MALNENMNISQVKMYRGATGRNGWGPIPEDVKSAFLNRRYRVVTVPRGTTLWKFTGYPINPNRYSPWWCTMDEFQENRVTLKDTLREALMNDVSFQTYVRLGAAVRYDWNELTRIRVIQLTEDAKGLWGQFAPQPKISAGATQVQQAGLQLESPHIPNMVGGLGAWQLWIPNLSNQSANLVADYRDSNRIMARFGLDD